MIASADGLRMHCARMLATTGGEDTNIYVSSGVRPRGWTGSGGGFGRARSVLILELHRAQIS